MYVTVKASDLKIICQFKNIWHFRNNFNIGEVKVEGQPTQS